MKAPRTKFEVFRELVGWFCFGLSMFGLGFILIYWASNPSMPYVEVVRELLPVFIAEVFVVLLYRWGLKL